MTLAKPQSRSARIGGKIAVLLVGWMSFATSRASAADSFTRDLIPLLTKAGCNAGACHGSFQGKGGFRLSLLGFDPSADYEALVKQAHGRRVHPAAPLRSLIWLKPTGTVPHGGGTLLTPDSPEAAVLRDWLTAGMPPPEAEGLAGVRLRVEPTELTLTAPAAAPSGSSGSESSLRVFATFPDGETRDVTRWALYDLQNKSLATVTRDGRVAALRPGRTSVTVRYLGQVAAVSLSIPFGPTTTFEFPATNFIDELAVAEWRRLGIQPAPLATDSTFVRRVYLDLIGTLPTAEETTRFVASADPDKRRRLIDELLERPEYVDYWSLRWGDLLRAHRRYLGEKGLASFNGWIRRAVRANQPLDELARELLTAQGNLFTQGAVGYFFVDEKVEDLAETTAQVFLGVRLQCTRCHHHPHEVWSQEDYYGLAAFFTRLESKDSGAQGAKFGGPKSLRVTERPHPNRALKMDVPPRTLGQTASSAAADSTSDPRRELAAWITHPDNPFFARNFANRFWGALFGVGLVEPIDDLRATNPASLPAVLDALAADFREHRYDPKHLLRTICNSRVYQLAPELHARRDADGRLFTHRVPRRLPAEVYLDAINQVAGTAEAYVGQPAGARAIALPDPTIASHFLQTFGRPLRNSACDCSRGVLPDLSQALHLLNGTALHDKLAASTGRLAQRLAANAPDNELFDELYLTALARHPTDEERQVMRETLAAGANRAESWQDLWWAVLNCAEFGFNH